MSAYCQYGKNVVTLISTIVLLSTIGLGVSVESYQPTDGSTVTEEPIVFAFAYNGTVPQAHCEVMGNEGEGMELIADNTSTHNDTVTTVATSEMMDGTWDYVVRCDATGTPEDSYTAEERSVQKTFTLDTGGDGGDNDGPDGGLASFSVDDLDLSTDTTDLSLRFNKNATLEGNILNILSFDSSKTYELQSQDGQTTYGTFNSSGKLHTTEDVTTELSEGRYRVENTDEGTSVAIDILGGASQVAGRLVRQQPDQGTLAMPSTTPDFDFRYWVNGSDIPESAWEAKKTGSIGSQSSTPVYQANISRDRYWIGVDFPSLDDHYVASRAISSFQFPGVSKPRVNDIRMMNQTNASIQIMNISVSDGSQTPTPAEGLKVKIARMDNKYPSRLPYMSAPPIKTTFTDGGGYANFTGLQGSPFSNINPRYFVEIVNDTYAKTPAASFDGDIGLTQYKGFDTNSFTINVNDTGWVKGFIEGGSSARYGLIAANQQSTHFFEGLGRGTFNISLPTGTYGLTAGKFTPRASGGIPSIQTLNLETPVTVQKRQQSGWVNISFPTTKAFNISVEGTNQKPVEDAWVSVENRSERKIYNGETNENGWVIIRAQNNTGYTATVDPFNSPYRETSTNITVNATHENATITLTRGSTVNGTVTDGNGNPVEGAFVNFQNFSENSFGDARTNASGQYSISGLENDTGYQVDVYPPIELSGEVHTTRTVRVDGADSDDFVQAKTETEDFTLKSRKAKLNGTITSSTGDGLAATVRVRSFEGSPTSLHTDDGTYSFPDLNRNRGYGIEVIPDDPAYQNKRTSLFLNENTSEDFVLTQATGLSGKIVDAATDEGVAGAFVAVFNYSEDSFGWDQTDSNGNYNVDVSPVDHQVEIYPEESSHQANMTNVSKADVQSGTYTFKVSDGVNLNGTVTGPNGDVSGTISVWNQSANSYRYQEFDSGTYNLSGLSDVGHNVYIRPNNESYKANRTTVDAPSVKSNTYDFSFTNKDGRKLRITLLENKSDGTAGGPIANATVGTPEFENQTNSNGIALLGKHNSGKVTIYTDVEGYRSVTKEVDVNKSTVQKMGTSVNVEYDNVTIKLNSVSERQVDVNVTKDGTLTPVAGANVVFTSNETGISKSGAAVTSSGNSTVTATVEHLTDGDYLLTVTTGPDDIQTRSVRLSKGEAGIWDVPENNPKYNVGYNVTQQ